MHLVWCVWLWACIVWIPSHTCIHTDMHVHWCSSSCNCIWLSLPERLERASSLSQANECKWSSLNLKPSREPNRREELFAPLKFRTQFEFWTCQGCCKSFELPPLLTKGPLGSFTPMAGGCSQPHGASGLICFGINSSVGQVFQFGANLLSSNVNTMPCFCGPWSCWWILCNCAVILY